MFLGRGRFSFFLLFRSFYKLSSRLGLDSLQRIDKFIIKFLFKVLASAFLLDNFFLLGFSLLDDLLMISSRERLQDAYSRGVVLDLIGYEGGKFHIIHSTFIFMMLTLVNLIFFVKGLSSFDPVLFLSFSIFLVFLR